MTMASLPHPRTRNTHVFARATDGWYQEPLWCSERLFDVEQFDGPILDIACGAGNVLHSAIGAGYEAIGIDIRSRSARPSKARFLQRDSLRGRLPVHGAIVCNPPYDRFREFVEMAV